MFKKKIGHHTRKEDMMGQSYLNYAYSGSNRVRCYFIGPHYILRCWKQSLLKVKCNEIGKFLFCPKTCPIWQH